MLMSGSPSKLPVEEGGFRDLDLVDLEEAGAADDD